MVYEVTAGNGTKYLYGLDLFAKVEGTTPTYYHYDAHGSVAATSDTGGQIYDREVSLTDAFGVPVIWAEGNDFLYSGEYLDGETGYYYLRARYYDPELGRFTQQDTYPGTIENPNSLEDLKNEPLLAGEELNLIGYSGGGQIVLNVCELLQGKADVNNTILIGTPVSELSLNNTGKTTMVYAGLDPLSWNGTWYPITYEFAGWIRHTSYFNEDNIDKVADIIKKHIN